jgi:hypothetical protein
MRWLSNRNRINQTLFFWFKIFEPKIFSIKNAIRKIPTKSRVLSTFFAAAAVKQELFGDVQKPKIYIHA